MRSWAVLGALTITLLTPDVLAVKSHDFKTCSQAGFCRRGRALSKRAHEAGANWASPYSLDASSVVIASDKAAFTASVKSSLYPDIKFGLELRLHDDGVVRVRMDEVNGLRKRYDEAASWALIAEPSVNQNAKWKASKKDVRVKFGAKKENEVVVQYQPLRVALLRNGKEQVVLNGQGLMHMEHFRTKAPQVTTTEEPAPEGIADGSEAEQVVVKQETLNPLAWFEGEEEDDWWDETFSSWTDSKPKGIPYTELSCARANLHY